MRVLLLSSLLLGIAGCGDGSSRKVSLRSEADPIAGLEQLGATIGRNEQGEVIGVVVATADAPTFIRATDSIPQNINWAVKSVFTSALFTPPAGSAASTVDPEDVIAHVTEATCLVEATRVAQ